jgi:hypothetical protein
MPRSRCRSYAHVTEEAAVYLAFNRVDRAIDVLREHIGTQPRSLPAAWLMLLDLYRSNSREQEFGRLAQEFHQHFNSQAPNGIHNTTRMTAV